MRLLPRALIAAAALAAVAAAGLGCGVEHLPTAATGSTGPALLLAFTSNRPPSNDLSSDIYLKDLSSDTPAYRAPNTGTIESVDGPCALSGDGRTMAFYSDRFYLGTIASLVLYDVASGQARILPSLQYDFNVENPALDMTGRRIAYQEQVGGAFNQQIVLRDAVADTLIPTPSLNDLDATNFDPALNGDGTLIVFADNGATSIGGYDIRLYSVPGDSFIATPGMNSALNELSASISADGRYIAFQSGRAGTNLIDVYVYDRQTSSLLDLPGLNTPLAEIQPAISPDGRWLVCSTESSGGRDLVLYDIREKHRVALPNTNDGVYFDEFPALANLPPSVVH